MSGETAMDFFIKFIENKVGKNYIVKERDGNDLPVLVELVGGTEVRWTSYISSSVAFGHAGEEVYMAILKKRNGEKTEEEFYREYVDIKADPT
jgi:hypothetical protein